MTETDRLYFRQLLSGRDFARNDQLAQGMRNFVYLIGDRETGECVVVDPAYGIDEVVETAAADGMRVTGALVTHYHADHCGGSMMGYEIEGVAELVGRCGCPVHVQADEVPWVARTTQLGEDDLVAHAAGDVVMVGEIPIQLLHTPGHTPGSQCFLVDGRLVAGDTLFLDGCGRTDLPGGDPEALYRSLHGVLAQVPDDTVLFPGHMYSVEPAAPMGDVRQFNMVFRPRSAEEWLSVFGR
ncbi:MAG: MBL fold metallo-hydrolase [Actinomycetes bacterium]